MKHIQWVARIHLASGVPTLLRFQKRMHRKQKLTEVAGQNVLTAVMIKASSLILEKSFLELWPTSAGNL